jgi:membrane-bound serine protease (ClpP class)
MGLAAAPLLRAETPPRAVYVIDIKGAISIATSEYVTRALGRARDASARLVVIRLDTPGGLVSSMREVISAILASPVPVAVYVAPAGARAASAGTYMVYAAHVAAMAPGTHLGAATPVALGTPSSPGESEKDKKDKKDEKDGMSASERKSVNDAVAYLRALAELRKRNADWAERAVRTAATLTSTDAAKENVIDLLAGDLRDLLTKIDGRSVQVLGAERRLETKDAPLVELEPDWRIKILAAIGDPTIAYLLLLIGFYGIIFEFWNPGTFAPGVIGAISLLLALGALSVLPVNYAGLGLVVLGVALMTAEVFTPGIGALGIGGLVAFVAGSALLFDPDAAPGVDFTLAWPVIAGAALMSALFFLMGLGMAWRARRRPVATGRERMIGSPGKVISWEEGKGTVRVLGETWRARSTAPLAPEDPVRIVGVEGLTVVVEPRTKGD